MKPYRKARNSDQVSGALTIISVIILVAALCGFIFRKNPHVPSTAQQDNHQTEIKATKHPLVSDTIAKPLNSAKQDGPESERSDIDHDKLSPSIQEAIAFHDFKLAYSIAASEPDARYRQSIIHRIDDARQLIRSGIESDISSSHDLNHISALLNVVIDKWGIPEDEQWATLLLRSNTERVNSEHPQNAAVVRGLSQDNRQYKWNGKDYLGGPIIQLFGNVINFCKNSNVLSEEKSILSSDSLANPSLAFVLSTWDARYETLDDAARIRKMRLVIPGVIAGSQAFISSVHDKKLFVSVGESTYEIAWKLFSLKEQARIFSEISSSEKSCPFDSQLSFICHVINGDVNMAMYTLKTYGSKWPVEIQSFAHAIVEIWGTYNVSQLFIEGNEAYELGDVAKLNECIKKLHSLDAAKSPIFNDGFIRLEGLYSNNSLPPTVISTDLSHVVFSADDDIKIFNKISGSWNIGKHGLSNVGDGYLERRGLSNIHSIRISLFPLVSKGIIVLHAMGAIVQIDLDKDIWGIQTSMESVADQPIAFFPRTSNIIDFSWDKSDGPVSINLNKSLQNIVVKCKDSSNVLSIKVSNGAALSICEIASEHFHDK